MATVSLITRIGATVSRTFKSQAAAIGPVFDDSNTFNLQDALAYGTGADQANVCYHAVETLSTGGSVLLDVSGTLKDAFGDTIIMSRVKCLAVQHRSAAGTISVGGGSNPMTTFWGATGDMLKIEADGGIVLWAPDATAYAVTASTAENIRILHNGDTAEDITVEFLIVGVEG